MSWVYLLIAIVSEVAGSTALKKVDGFNQPIPLAIVVCGYASAIYFLTLTIKTMSLGVIYAIWSGVGIICISILGWKIYDQKLDLAAIKMERGGPSKRAGRSQNGARQSA